MLRKLQKENLIKFSPYSKIYLTSKGKKISGEIHNKHQTLTKFIQKLTDFEEEKAIQEAHKLKHAFSDESLRIIQNIMNIQPDIIKRLKPLPSYVN